jgi:hypothetical protein
LSVLIWASAMMRVLKGLPSAMRSEGTSLSKISKSQCQFYQNERKSDRRDAIMLARLALQL